MIPGTKTNRSATGLVAFLRWSGLDAIAVRAETNGFGWVARAYGLPVIDGVFSTPSEGPDTRTRYSR